MPDSGKVFIEEKDMYALRGDALAAFRREKIGFIFQDFNLIPSLTVWENVVLPLGLAGKKVKENDVSDVLKNIGIDDKKNALPSTLSGGQKQRCAIARALVSSPAIILADEPTGNIELVQHYSKKMLFTWLLLSILISSITDRQRVRFSSRVNVL